MENIKSRIYSIIEAQLERGLTDSEFEELWGYLQDPILESEIKNSLDHFIYVEKGQDSLNANQQKKILNNIFIDKDKKVFSISLFKKIAIAALVLFTLSIGFYFYQDRPKGLNEIVDHTIKPGKEGATLTLSNNEVIHLDQINDDRDLGNKNIKIYKDADGVLVYEPIRGDQNSTNGFNTLETSLGETFKVKLPDGSKVWLNAKSKLIYPVNMLSEERRIKLIGEAYFEVAKLNVKKGNETQRSRFIVETKLQEVQVLGTEFNISAYADDSFISTTLVEGHVNVSAMGKLNELRPGQQTIITNSNIVKKEVNTKFYTAWKDGAISFMDEDLQTILKQASRWYNVNIIYKDPSVKVERYEGVVSRYSDITTMLKALELTGDVRFEIKGDEIYVYKKE